MLGKHQQAARLYEQVLLLRPFDSQSALKLGELRRKIGDAQGALAAYRRAAALLRAKGFEAKAAAIDRVAAELGAGDSATLRADYVPWWRRWLVNASRLAPAWRSR